MQLSIPSALIFEDGSRVDYLSRSGTLIYVSPARNGIQIPVLHDTTNNELQILMPVDWKWDKPKEILIPHEEIKDIENKIAQYVEKQGKPFTLREN